MKATMKLAAIATSIILTVTVSAEAQRGRGWMGQPGDSAQFGRRGAMAPRHMQMNCQCAPAPQGMPGQGFHGRQMQVQPRPGFTPGHPGRPGMRHAENIPNLTDQQKKDIQALQEKQMEEMKKLREESDAKFKALREAHHKKFLELLTPEQKKLFEAPAAPAAPAEAPGKKL